MANLNGFDASQVEPSVGFDPIPAGTYLATITASENKPTKAGDGSYLELTFTILEGPYKNRRVWARLNLDNPNPTTVKIAQGDLSAICRAVGVLKPRDSVELHNLPLAIRVGLKKRDDNGELTNEVKTYEPKSALVSQPAAGPAPVASQPQTTSTTPPWRR